MTSITTDIQSANVQAVVTPGNAVWLRSMRNSSVPLAPGYQKMMVQLKEEFDALDRLQANKSADRFPSALPSQASTAQKVVAKGIPPVPRLLRDQVAQQQKKRLDTALAAWTGYYGQKAAAA